MTTTTNLLYFLSDPFLPVSNPEAEALSLYLHFDNWTTDQGLCVLCRIDPERSDIQWGVGERKNDVKVIGCRRLDGQVIGAEEAEARLRRYKQLWSSGTHRKLKNSPMYFMEWAIKHDLAIEWLDWAVETRRCPDPRKTGFKHLKAAREEGDLSGNRNTTALKLIGGLLMAGWGMNIHADRLTGLEGVLQDLERVGCKTDAQTLRTWIKEAARNIDKKQ
jgi:hypothetical protein